jgi:hypothetical protein
MGARLTDFAASAKAWVGAAIAGLTGLSTIVVADSVPGKLIAAGLGFLVALYAVFAKANAPATKPPADDYLG